MSIVSSSATQLRTQQDGRVWVTEVHVDNIGLSHVIGYLVAAGTDVAAALAAHATQLALDLRDTEIASNVAAVVTLGSMAAITLNYSTAAQGRAALRAAYRDATQTQAVMIGDFLSSLTDAQLQSLFSMTQLQVTTLRANKLTPAANTAATIRSTTGGA